MCGDRGWGRRGGCREAVEVDVCVVAEDAPVAVLFVVFRHRRPNAMPALLLLKLERECSMALRPPILPLLPYLRQPKSFNTTIRTRPRARLECLVGQRNGRSMRYGEAEVSMR